MDQSSSVFIPGLTRRGAVYNSDGSIGALPALSSNMKYLAMGALLYLGYRKKIPMLAAAAGAAALWKFFPDSATVNSGVPTAVTDPNALAAPITNMNDLNMNLPQMQVM